MNLEELEKLFVLMKQRGVLELETDKLKVKLSLEPNYTEDQFSKQEAPKASDEEIMLNPYHGL